VYVKFCLNETVLPIQIIQKCNWNTKYILKVSRIQNTNYIMIYFKYEFRLLVFQILHNTASETMSFSSAVSMYKLHMMIRTETIYIEHQMMCNENNTVMSIMKKTLLELCQLLDDRSATMYPRNHSLLKHTKAATQTTDTICYVNSIQSSINGTTDNSDLNSGHMWNEIVMK